MLQLMELSHQRSHWLCHHSWLLVTILDYWSSFCHGDNWWLQCDQILPLSARIWLVRPSLGLYCDAVSVTYYWICKFSCRWLNYFKRTLVPNPPFFRWPDSNAIAVTPFQFTFLSQLWFALLDCSQHQVSNSCCRHAVQTTPYPLHCDNVQVLSACVICTVHNSTHGQPQGYTELCPRWPLLSYTVER